MTSYEGKVKQILEHNPRSRSNDDDDFTKDDGRNEIEAQHCNQKQTRENDKDEIVLQDDGRKGIESKHCELKPNDTRL